MALLPGKVRCWSSANAAGMARPTEMSVDKNACINVKRNTGHRPLTSASARPGAPSEIMVTSAAPQNASTSASAL